MVAKKARVNSPMPMMHTARAVAVQPKALASCGPVRVMSASAMLAAVRAQATSRVRSVSSLVITLVSDQ